MFRNVDKVWMVAAVAVMAAMAAPVARAADDDDDAPHNLVVMADFNHDGIADVAEIPRQEKNSAGQAMVVVTLGGKSSGAEPVAKITIGRSPQAITVGDFNRDGNPDLMVGDDDGSLRVFFGDGAGGFTPVAESVRLSSIVSLAVADFNHDGILDVAVSDWRSTSVTILLGAGDGSFRKGWSFPLRMAGTMPQLMTADFNHDHVPDLAVIYDDESGVTFDVMVGNNTGMFLFSPTLSASISPSAACVPEQLVDDPRAH